ncbi:MAG: hypothetical protein K2X91_11950, partial [Thermoleophilia bacterium]|nr:hypothetical protein [Thermoleophilia bacterium]
MTWTVFAGALLATSIEVVEVVAIVVAVGVSRSWRAALSGAAAGLGVLIVLVAGLGPALQDVSLAPLRIVVGSLLMIFGLGWLRKGILRVSRDGWAAGGAGSGDVDAPYGPARGFDSTAFVISFKGVSLEGLEIAVIVVALGSAAGDLASASAGAAVAVVALSALGALAHRAVA